MTKGVFCLLFFPGFVAVVAVAEQRWGLVERREKWGEGGGGGMGKGIGESKVGAIPSLLTIKLLRLIREKKGEIKTLHGGDRKKIPGMTSAC